MRKQILCSKNKFQWC